MIQTSKSAVAEAIYRRGVDYRVLGPLEVRAGAKTRAIGGPKQRAVLAVLIAAAGEPVSVDALLQAVYGDAASPNSRATLHTYVSNLRGTLGDVIVRRADSYLIDMAGSTTDAFQFEHTYNAALQLASAEDMASQLREALSMWRGHPYADVETHGHLDGQITRLNELRLAAIEARIDADLRLGRHREVVAELDALTVDHPFRESLRAMHMLALYRSGRQGEALRAYAHTRVVLVEELGIDPSPELQDLERRILQQDRQLLLDVAPTVERRAVVVADIDDSGWSGPAEREIAFARRDSALARAADEHGGVRLAPKGSAAYAVFAEPIEAVRAAQAAVDGRTRVAVDFGDLQLDDGEPLGPPLTRAARLVAVAHPGQALLSPAAHEALTFASAPGWAAQSLGRFDIVGLDRGLHIFQLVGHGFGTDFPDLELDRLPPPLPSAAERSMPGYELRSLLGIGELGEVHRAYQPSVGREVAVRVFGPGMVGHPQFLRRFETAAQRIARVDHPGVVPLLDYWREPTRAVLVSRLLAGGTLFDRLPGSGYDLPTALRIFETVASAVASAHRRDIVHGRLRPNNVLFDDDGNAYVADFGVDEMCTGVAGLATSSYDAPERLGGTLATPSSDIYSLGVLFHVLVSGTAPPADAELPPLSSPVADVVARATDNDPRRRHASVEEFVIELRERVVGSNAAPDPLVPTRNPYRGLAAFERADADDFFGRDHATGDMISILRDQPLLWVVGPSGIGKSSTVKAGVLPALASGAIAGSESWLVTEMVPGRSPLAQLATALARIATDALPDVFGDLMANTRSLGEIVTHIAGSNVVVLVIDQFEELFTETVDDRERRAFLRILVDVASQPAGAVRVIATMRADFFDRPLAYPGFADAVKSRSVVLGAMSLAELADAVTRPAAGVGVDIDPVLVDRLTADAATQPGSLPLLQQVMTDLFARRTSSEIGIAAYLEAGELAGAIRRQADAIYERLDERHQNVTRRLFVRLVNVNEEGVDTRRRVRRTELEQAGFASDDVDVVLSEFGNARLLTFDRDPTSRTPTVEVAHEALLSQWSRLRGWIDDAREDLLNRRRLELATHEWINANYDSSFLIGGGRLELTEQWAVHSGFALTHDEKQFISTSRTKFDRELRTRTRRRRRAVGGLLVALLATTTLSVVAFSQRNRADDNAAESNRQKQIAAQERNRATAQRDTARIDRLVAESERLLPTQLDLAGLLAVEARMRSDAPNTRGALLTSLAYTIPTSTKAGIPSRFLGYIQPAADIGDDGVALDLSDDGKVVAVSSAYPQGSQIAVYEVASHHRLAETTTPLTLQDLDLSADGRTVVGAGFFGQSDKAGYGLAVLDVATGASATFDTDSSDKDSYEYVRLLSDGTALALVHSRELASWDIAAHGLSVRALPLGPFNWFDVTADGTLVTVDLANTTVSWFDLATSTTVRSQALEAVDMDLPNGLYAVSPDGRTLAIAGWQGPLFLWDLTTGKVIPDGGGRPSGVRSVDFDPADPSVLVVTTTSGALEFFDTADNAAIGDPVRVHANGMRSVAFDASGRSMAALADDRRISLWGDSTSPGLVDSPFVDDPAFPMALFSPDREHMLVYGDRAELRRVDKPNEPGVVLRPADGQDVGYYHAAFDAEGRRVLLGRPNGVPAYVADASTGAVIWTDSSGLQAVDISPDGSLVVVHSWDAVELWDVDANRRVAQKLLADLGIAPPFQEEIEFTADGRFVDFLANGVAVRLTVPDLSLVHTVTNHGGQCTVAHLPGSDLLVSMDGRSRVSTYDLSAGKVIATGSSGDSTSICGVGASPDGSIVAAQHWVTHHVTLFDGKTMRAVGTPIPVGDAGDGWATPAFPDATHMVFASPDGGLARYDLDSDHWQADVCQQAGRNLSAAEWAEYIGADEPYRATCPQWPAGT